MEMTVQTLKKLCREQQLYTTPYLNDKLYLHYKGFAQISDALREYTGLRALWLEGNGLAHIENLEAQSELRCLFLQENCIERIQNLSHLIELDTLNLNDNHIGEVENLSMLPKLKTLSLARNKLAGAESLRHLCECPSICVLDISRNNIDDPSVVSILAQMPDLTVLNMAGNPVVKRISHYRKTLIAALPKLTYLDDRPVFPSERRLVTAWASGGAEAEREERQLIQAEEQEKEERNRQAFRTMVEKGRSSSSEPSERTVADEGSVIGDLASSSGAGRAGDKNETPVAAAFGRDSSAPSDERVASCASKVMDREDAGDDGQSGSHGAALSEERSERHLASTGNSADSEPKKERVDELPVPSGAEPEQIDPPHDVAAEARISGGESASNWSIETSEYHAPGGKGDKPITDIDQLD